MLRYLRVTNLAVVREATIELEDGLTVLTGETGAGKSILVDALTLLLGARSSADLVRTGEREATVQGIFRVESNPAAREILDSFGVEPEDGDVVLRREVLASGKGRAFINGTLQPIAALRRLGTVLADVYGQHEHVRLLESAMHLDLLDHFAGLDASRREIAELARRRRELEARLAELERGQAERARRADFLGFELNEIEEARPVPGEQQELERERSVLANRGRVLELAEGVYQSLYESEGAALERLARAHRDLAELASYDPRLASLPGELEGARAGLEDLALTLRDYARDVPVEPGRLETVEARLTVLDRLRRKYGPSLEDVLGFAAEARAELSRLGNSAGEKEALERERDEVRAAYGRHAELLSKGRRSAAGRLERRVESELEELAMEGARFRVLLEAAPDGSSAGLESAEFRFSANAGEEPRPLGRVASGGELSRLLLALRTVASDHEPSRIAVFHGLEAGLGGRVAVFDEVDAGIGGRVAYVLARKLKRLARGRQVLCITHLAPVAAGAERHLRVRKEERRGRTEVVIETLSRADRVEELSRMIGGDAITESVRRHAAELLAAGTGEGGTVD